MSVRKVKISELPQLPNDAEAGEVFMAATAQQNNKSYRVPLSRYDNAKRGAEEAAQVANAAAQAANEAAQAANAVVAGELAGIGTPGIVTGLSSNMMDHIDVFYDNMSAAWNSMIGRGNIMYQNGIGSFLTSVFELHDYFNSETMAVFLFRPLFKNNPMKLRPAIISFSIIGLYQPTLEEDPFLEEYNKNGTIEFTIEEPLSCCMFGGGTFVTWRGYAAFVTPPNEDGRSWYRIGGTGSDYELPVATAKAPGIVKPGAGLKMHVSTGAADPVDASAIEIAADANLPGMPTVAQAVPDGIRPTNGITDAIASVNYVQNAVFSSFTAWGAGKTPDLPVQYRNIWNAVNKIDIRMFYPRTNSNTTCTVFFKSNGETVVNVWLVGVEISDDKAPLKAITLAGLESGKMYRLDLVMGYFFAAFFVTYHLTKVSIIQLA